jgi:lipopolysaccharide heptosyltransferase II
LTPGEADGRRIIRAPNHLGDVVMALPALADAGDDVLVRRWLAPVLEMAGLPGRVLPMDRGFGGWSRAVVMLRSLRYEHGTLLTPSFSAAWLMRWGEVHRLRGTASDGRSFLVSDAIPRDALRGHHRINQYRLLLEQDPTGEPQAPRLTPPEAAVSAWRGRLGDEMPLVALFPGSNAPARRWPAQRFAEVATALSRAGARVVVLGGPSDRAVTAEVASQSPGVVDAGGETDLGELAAVLSMSRLLVTNDTGPMHLASAVGTSIVTLWGPSDPSEVRPTGLGHVAVHGPSLPCKPCLKNECPRSGAGTLSPQAHEECMHLIPTEQVIQEAIRALDRAAA